MHPITLPNARALDLPTRWGEVTLGQAARFAEIENLDTYNLLSVFLDLSPVEVMNLPAAFVNERVLPWLAFATTEMPDLGSLPRPALLSLPGAGEFSSALAVLPALDLTTFGQATDLGALLMDTTVPVSQKRLRALAIVFYPAYHEAEYDSDAVAEFTQQVCSHALLEQALPITDFFLRNSVGFAASTPASSSASRSPATSTPPASKPWWKSGIRWLWSTRWPVETKPAGPSFSASPGAR